jgi:hypothetical protein
MKARTPGRRKVDFRGMVPRKVPEAKVKQEAADFLLAMLQSPPRAGACKELRKWPPEALDYLHAAFRETLLRRGPGWLPLLADIKARFGLTWNDSALSRYWGYWYIYILPREEMARWIHLAERALAAVEEIRDAVRRRGDGRPAAG